MAPEASAAALAAGGGDPDADCRRDDDADVDFGKNAGALFGDDDGDVDVDVDEGRRWRRRRGVGRRSPPPSPPRTNAEGWNKKKRRRAEGGGGGGEGGIGGGIGEGGGGGGTAAPTTAANDELCSPWDCGHDDGDDVVDEDSIEVVVWDDLDDGTDADPPRGDDEGYDGEGRSRRRRLKIRSRPLPYSDDELFFLGRRQREEVFHVGDGDCASTTTATTEARTKRMRSLESLRGRIEAADALVQSRAPTYIEFRARTWHPELPSSSSPPRRGVADEDDDANDDGSPGGGSAAAMDYRSMRTFVAIAPRSRPHASSASAREFLAALQSAAAEASPPMIAAGRLRTGDGSRSSEDRVDDNEEEDDGGGGGSGGGRWYPRPSDAVMEFLAIVAESRGRPQASPFHLMKKVWTLIASVAYRCKDGAKLGNALAAKFDVFLPNGYSMASSNLLVLEGTLRTGTGTGTGTAVVDDGDKDLAEGCARTEEEYRYK